MAYYESFFVRKITKEGSEKYNLKNVDTRRIESSEWLDDEHTIIVMFSGDKFIVKETNVYITNLMMANNDEFGRLFKFNQN